MPFISKVIVFAIAIFAIYQYVKWDISRSKKKLLFGRPPKEPDLPQTAKTRIKFLQNSRNEYEKEEVAERILKEKNPTRQELEAIVSFLVKRDRGFLNPDPWDEAVSRLRKLDGEKYVATPFLLSKFSFTSKLKKTNVHHDQQITQRSNVAPDSNSQIP